MIAGKIMGTGSCVPKEVWDNDKISELVETSDEWIQERTGIIRRHIAAEQTATELAVSASHQALQDSGLSPQDIGAIFVCTMSADTIMPSIACAVQEALNASNAFCMDLNAACSGFVFAYNTAMSYIQMGQIKYAMIVGSEVLSDLVDWKDRGTCILFGDGAGAVVVGASGQEGKCVMHSDGSMGEALICRQSGKIQMDGQQVFRFAVKRVPECIQELLEQMGCDKSEIDYFILHQANRRIVEAVAKRLKQPIEKFPMNLHEYGNTSSASIPILLEEYRKNGQLVPGQKLVLAGFGGGLSWGAAYVIA